MTLLLHDGARGRLRPFVPHDPEHVKMYVCGPTVYDRIHLGNARSIVVYDVLYRLLRHLYPRVSYARNITDVDDKIITRAKELGKSPPLLAREMLGFFEKDAAALGCLKPTFEPRATTFIPDIIDFIARLLREQWAYIADDGVYFQVERYSSYGTLSHRKLEQLNPGARVPKGENKKSPLDFALWKRVEEGAWGWPTPWGYGRPGWHTECVVMASSKLGLPFDLHGGGVDLLFPHHENESAQAMCAFGTFANMWVRNGLLTVDGEKMSKSTGNFFYVGDTLKSQEPAALRLYFLLSHYRKPLDFTEMGLRAAKHLLQHMRNIMAPYRTLSGRTPTSEFLEALCRDMGTPKALSILREEMRQLQRHPTSQRAQSILAALNLLGLQISTQKESFVDPNYVQKILKEREEARKGGDYLLADRLRDKLKKLGISIEDTKTGTRWRSEN